MTTVIRLTGPWTDGGPEYIKTENPEAIALGRASQRKCEECGWRGSVTIFASGKFADRARSDEGNADFLCQMLGFDDRADATNWM